MSNSAIFDYIIQKYHRIMSEEIKLADNNWHVPSSDEMYNTAIQIAASAKSSTVPRSYIRGYHLAYDQPIVFESVGSHTNLVSVILDAFLDWYYGPDAHTTDDGYDFKIPRKLVFRHDLPENISGDTPDDDSRNETEKIQFEEAYQHDYSAKSPSRANDVEKKVLHLHLEMNNKSSFTGRQVYSSDKISAILMALCLDSLGHPPLKRTTDRLTDRDRQEMALCDINIGNAYHASEMWTIDYLKMRHLVDYDDTGFFTALLVMYTLQTHLRWYHWREADYSPEYCSS